MLGRVLEFPNGWRGKHTILHRLLPSEVGRCRQIVVYLPRHLVGNPRTLPKAHSPGKTTRVKIHKCFTSGINIFNVCNNSSYLNLLISSFLKIFGQILNEYLINKHLYYL